MASSGQSAEGGDSAIDAVRNGIIEEHEATPVGKAFESAFQNGKWSSVRTPAGQTVVQFDGTASTEALIAAGFVPIVVGGSDDDRVVPVQFQFTLSVYGRTVFVERVGSMPFIYVNGEGAGAFSAKRALNFVYKQRFDGLHATAKTTNQLRLAATTPTPETADTVEVDAPASHPAAPLKAFNIASLTQGLLRPVSPADLPEAPAVRGPGASSSASLPVVSQTMVPLPPKPAPAPPTNAVEPAPSTGGRLIPAKVVSRVEPEWKVARLAGASGPVELEATISVDGRVKNPHAVSGNTLLQKAAIDAVLQWRYQPAMLNGKPVDSPVKIKLNFIAH
jgi:protein TonB